MDIVPLRGGVEGQFRRGRPGAVREGGSIDGHAVHAFPVTLLEAFFDDVSGKTLIAASSADKGIADFKGNKIEQAKLVGKSIAEKASKAGIATIRFDRNGYLYHGRVKSLAEGAREAGLKF